MYSTILILDRYIVFNGVPSNCFPSATGLCSSFDVDLARRIGEALGDECRAKGNLLRQIYDQQYMLNISIGSHILLGPTVNTQRSPLGGRGFESFSEDPQLNGLISAAYINGLQSTGIAATIKHFVANDQEYQRYFFQVTTQYLANVSVADAFFRFSINSAYRNCNVGVRQTK